MLNGFKYKWIDVTEWEFARINTITRKLTGEGWELDGVVEETVNGSSNRQGCISLRFKRQAAA